MLVRKKRLLFDLDGVVVDLCPSWLALYNEATGENVKVEDIVEWDMFKQVKRPKVLGKLLLQKRFFSKPKPYLDVLDYLPKILKDPRFEVFVVTQVPRNSERGGFEKRMWLKKYFPDFDVENFISAHKKYMVCGDLLLDDHPRHTKGFIEENADRFSVIMNHPYNQDAIADYRVTCWKEISELLEKLWTEKWNPPRPKGCNRHKDCSTAKTECCHDSCCDECFGY